MQNRSTVGVGLAVTTDDKGQTMRVNTKAAVVAFMQGDYYRAASGAIKADDGAIYSYGTCLVARVAGGLAFNATRYSMTTTTQQNGLRVALGHLFVAEVSDLPQGASEERLKRAACEMLGLAQDAERAA